MKKIPIDKILRVKQKSFEAAWKYGGELLNDRSTYDLQHIAGAASPGKPHPLNELIERMRQRLLQLGFDEIINETIFPQEDVLKQWGPTAYAILDRCYYLAALPRPDVGLSSEKQAAIKSFNIDLPPEKVAALQLILHKLKTGELEGDELVREIGKELDIEDDCAVEVFEKVFDEFKDLKPIPSNLTLRSHMTAAWFDTLASIQKKTRVPVKLFSIGPRYRREQREDATHLRVHDSASCVVMDEDVTIDLGKWIVKEFLLPFGFEDFQFRQVATGTDTYYAPGKHFEAFAFHPGFKEDGSEDAGWLEVADFGLYSPLTLANYGIEFPVVNCGIGVERIAMLMHGYKDIRTLVFPQFYEDFVLSDEQLVNFIALKKKPTTVQGQEIQLAIIDTCKTHGADESPIEVLAWEGELLDKPLRVSVIEPEENTRLCGPAYLNEVFVKDGNIIGAIKSDGVSTGITYIEAFAAEAAYAIEQALKMGKTEVDVRVKIARSPNDINLSVDPVATRYITSRNKRIDLRGPVFTTIRMRTS
ncbi:MAG: O-phosphoserine--tRNA ligase [Halobacteriota archaeon]